MNYPKNNKARGSALHTFAGSIVILFIALFLLVKLATSGYYSNVATSTPSATQTRIRPAGSINVGEGIPIGSRTGKQIFDRVCVQCHAATSNVPNAPRITHNADWAPRIAKGIETLFVNALNGFNAMPPKGGQLDLTDNELKRAIIYITNQSGGHFQPPENDSTVSNTSAAATATAIQPAAIDGKKIFNTTCVACHGASSIIPNIPKITKNNEWAARIKQGKEILFKHAIEGFTGSVGFMPAKGGNPALSDDEVKAAVIYMVNESGGNI